MSLKEGFGDLCYNGFTCCTSKDVLRSSSDSLALTVGSCSPIIKKKWNVNPLSFHYFYLILHFLNLPKTRVKVENNWGKPPKQMKSV